MPTLPEPSPSTRGSAIRVVSRHALSFCLAVMACLPTAHAIGTYATQSRLLTIPVVNVPGLGAYQAQLNVSSGDGSLRVGATLQVVQLSSAGDTAAVPASYSLGDQTVVLPALAVRAADGSVNYFDVTLRSTGGAGGQTFVVSSMGDTTLGRPSSGGSGTGPQGETGPAGPAGPAGAAGAVGLVGSAGATGAVGAAGPAGATGAVGAAGPAGATGAVGAVGPAGATGAVGAAGPAGGGLGFAEFYSQDAYVQPVQDVPFVTSGLSGGNVLARQGCCTEFVFSTGGTYLVMLHARVNSPGAFPLSLMLLVNGSVVTRTAITTSPTLGQSAGMAIVLAGPGDTLSVRNYSGFDSGHSGSVFLQLIIQRLN